MILKKESFSSAEFNTQSFISKTKLLELITESKFYDDLLKVFDLEKIESKVLKIGNAKQLVNSILTLDSKCTKIDIDSHIRNIQLDSLLEDEKALFEIFEIKNDFIIKKIGSDKLSAETRYDAKTDLLDYYHFSKFANYCRDLEYKDLVNSVKKYLLEKNKNNSDSRSVRLIYVKEENKFYIRAITSTEDYKDFGINFSVFVALFTLARYVESSNVEVYIDNFVVDDSNIYVSFTLANSIPINKNMTLSFSLILENNEVKRGAVSFNGLFKLNYNYENKENFIYIKPKGYKTDGSYPIDLLNYNHRGSVKKVLEKMEELPELIDHFIKQVSKDAIEIESISNFDDVRKHLSQKIKFSKKEEFKKYKEQVFNKLMSITVDSTFKMFELFRSVEDLFEHDDVISVNFWRTKLYESLVEKK